MINGLDFISLAFYISQFVFLILYCVYIYIHITHTYIIFIYEIFYVSSVSSLFPSTSGTVHNVRNDEAKLQCLTGDSAEQQRRLFEEGCPLR